MKSKLTAFEREGMRHNTFPMDKDEGIAACLKHREELGRMGISTQLVFFGGGLFTVKGVGKDGILFDVPTNATVWQVQMRLTWSDSASAFRESRIMENAFNSCAEYINSYAARVDNARKRLAEVEAQIEALENLKLW